MAKKIGDRFDFQSSEKNIEKKSFICDETGDKALYSRKASMFNLNNRVWEASFFGVSLKCV